MDTNMIVIIGLGVLVIALTIAVYLMNEKLSKFMQGKSAKSLEKTLFDMIESNKFLHEEQQEIRDAMKSHDTRIKNSIKNISTLRFNPFQDSGGNQSFAIALLNENKDGVIVSSLYSREKTSVFAKPVVRGKSEYELTEEEHKVLDESLKN